MSAEAPYEAPAAGADAGEPADTLPVLAQEATVVEDHRLRRSSSRAGGPRRRSRPCQAAAVAAGGFVAGAAVVGLVARRQRHTAALAKSRGAGRLARGRRRGGAPSAGELVQIVGSRSLLVDVHLLGGSRLNAPPSAHAGRRAACGDPLRGCLPPAAGGHGRTDAPPRSHPRAPAASRGGAGARTAAQTGAGPGAAGGARRKREAALHGIAANALRAWGSMRT